MCSLEKARGAEEVAAPPRRGATLSASPDRVRVALQDPRLAPGLRRGAVGPEAAGAAFAERGQDAAVGAEGASPDRVRVALQDLRLAPGLRRGAAGPEAAGAVGAERVLFFFCLTTSGPYRSLGDLLSIMLLTKTTREV